jgi:hypothetical protein
MAGQAVRAGRTCLSKTDSGTRSLASPICLTRPNAAQAADGWLQLALSSGLERMQALVTQDAIGNVVSARARWASTHRLASGEDYRRGYSARGTWAADPC